MSETIEAAAPAAVAAPELSIAFTAEEMVVLGRVLAETLAILGPSPLAAVPPKARDDVLASAARSLRARNVLSGPADLAAVDRAVAGLVQIAARPALRAELVVDFGAQRHRRYLSIPYASVQHEVDDGLHRLTPFATSDLLARILRDADVVERVAADVAGFDLPFGLLHQARAAIAGGDLDGARSILRQLADDPVAPDDALDAADIDPADIDPELDDIPDEPVVPTSRPAAAPSRATAVPRASLDRFVDALAAGGPVNAVRLVHTESPTRSVGGEVAWLDGGDAGIWRLPTIDQPFAVVGSADGGAVEPADPDHLDPALARAVVRVEPIAAADLASFLFDLLPSPSG